MYGYAISCGRNPREIDVLSKEEQLSYLALAELNEEKRIDSMYKAFKRALVEINNEIFRGGN